MDVVFGLLCSMYAPVMYARSFLSHNFKFDSSTNSKSEKRRNLSEIPNIVNDMQENAKLVSKVDALAERFRFQQRFMLQPPALSVILEKLSSIKSIRISMCAALVSSNCAFCGRCCLRSKSLKLQGAF